MSTIDTSTFPLIEAAVDLDAGADLSSLVFLMFRTYDRGELESAEIIVRLFFKALICTTSDSSASNASVTEGRELALIADCPLDPPNRLSPKMLLANEEDAEDKERDAKWAAVYRIDVRKSDGTATSLQRSNRVSKEERATNNFCFT